MDVSLLLANIFSQIPGNWGLAAALAAACFLLLRGNWLKQKRSQDSTPDPVAIQQSFAPKTRELSAHHAPEDLLRWQVEMHELARDVKAEIDTKVLALQSLMIIANEHAQRLESLIAQAEKNGATKAEPPITGREILTRIENMSRDLPPLNAKAQGREVLNAAQAKLARQLAEEHDYTPVQIAQYIGASTVDVEMFLSLHSPTV
ncbi:hypothetical protein [Anatilimnocola floriformis]|uniref:hypothetical protein n=1 Tax=Anatilimnocola floriformis TaxID=2948575 RepID=UPI0020C36C31|nr:hypothetical protein [Anatilimnocola floriformis]